LNNFTSLGLSEPILRALNAEGYETPTPIQSKFIPAMIKGGDLVGIAQTGTGKTAAFLLPLLNRIAQNRKEPGPKGCSALIVVPTRELATQIANGISTYAQFMQHSATVVVGGVKPHKQIKRMSTGVDILVATPGRLEDHIQTGKIQLNSTTTVVLDEADQMLDFGFVPAIRRILAKLPANRQTVLLSATMPKQIRKLANEFLNDPFEIAVTPESKPIDKIEQSIRHVDKPAKNKMLIEILKGEGVTRTIVFSRTKHGANKISKNVNAAGLKSAAIHGNKSQNQRDKTLKEFRNGDLAVLIATDVAARGIDIDGVTHVINYDLPEVAEVYVHRIGRTARAGASGIAISLCDTSQRGLLRDIEKLIGRKLPVVGPSAEEVGPETEPEKRGGGGGGQRRQGGGQGARQGGAQSRNRTQGGNRKRGPKKPGGKPDGNKSYNPAAKAEGRPAAKPAGQSDNRPNSGSNDKQTQKPAQGLGSKPKRSRNRRRNQGAAHRGQASQ
jgi:ATP-dependent RNA helicase RhlE